jgi:DNA repair exonuclease SbcCD ATPase subunit
LAAILVIAGIAYWLHFRILQQGEQIQEDRGKARQIGQELDDLKSETTQALKDLPESQEELRKRLAAVEKVLNDASEALNLLRQQANERQASNAISLARTTELHRRGQKMRETLKTLAEGLAQWKNSPDDLMSTEEGKRIAADSDLLLEFIAIDEDPCPSPGDVKSWQEQVEELLTRVDSAYDSKDGFFVAVEGLETKISELDETIREADGQFRDKRRKIAGILDRAPEVQSGGDGPTLQQAIDAQLKAWDAERAQAIKERMELARKENDQLIANAKAEAEKLKTEELARVEKQIGQVQARQIAEAAAEYARKERERIAERAAEIARQELERDYSRDQQSIQTFLQPFLADGYRQPDLNGMYTTSTTKGPVSLSALRATRALDPGIHGLAALSLVVERSDRPHAGWPRLKVSGERLVQAGLGIRPVGPDQEFLQRAQDLLNKYGELLVEKNNRLAP